MTSYLLRLPKETLKALQDRAKEEDLSVAQLIRKILSNWLKGKKKL